MSRLTDGRQIQTGFVGHVRKQVVGIDADFVDGPTVTDPSVNMNTFTPGLVVRVEVIAANEVGDSAPSQIVGSDGPVNKAQSR